MFSFQFYISHSTTPEPSVPLSFHTHSDHKSEDKIPIPVSSGSNHGDQRGPQTPKSFDSKSGELASGRSYLEYSYQGISRDLQVQDLARIRAQYSIPDSFSMVVPHIFFWACFRQPVFIILYKDTFVASAYLPFHPLTWDLLCFLGISPAQLTPNAQRLLMGVPYLWPQYFGYELTLYEFMWTF